MTTANIIYLLLTYRTGYLISAIYEGVTLRGLFYASGAVLKGMMSVTCTWYNICVRYGSVNIYRVWAQYAKVTKWT